MAVAAAGNLMVLVGIGSIELSLPFRSV